MVVTVKKAAIWNCSLFQNMELYWVHLCPENRNSMYKQCMLYTVGA